MATQQIQIAKLTGWPAAGVVVALLAFTGYRYASAHQALQGPQLEPIKQYLQARYADGQLDGVREALEAGDTATASAGAEAILALEDIEITDVSALGDPDDMVVRVEVEVAGGPPPDGESTRYFRVAHSLLTGLGLPTETTALRYYLAMF